MNAVLIAGGLSRRMGSDKCLLPWGGRLLWQHQLNTLAALAPASLAVAAPVRPDWLPAEVSWLPDAQADAGPLAGILAALQAAGSGQVVVLAVDLPRMTSDYLQKLLAEPEPGVVPLSKKGYEPISAVYPAEAADSANAWLAAGRRDLQGWVSGLADRQLIQPRIVAETERHLFHNWNRPEDITNIPENHEFLDSYQPDRP